MNKEKITHKEAIDYVGKYIPEGLRGFISVYIRQQQEQEKFLHDKIDKIENNAFKQERLLELYKKLLKLEHEDFHGLYKGNSEKYFEEWNKIFDKIKELENDYTRIDI